MKSKTKAQDQRTEALSERKERETAKLEKRKQKIERKTESHTELKAKCETMMEIAKDVDQENVRLRKELDYVRYAISNFTLNEIALTTEEQQTAFDVLTSGLNYNSETCVAPEGWEQLSESKDSEFPEGGTVGIYHETSA